MYSLFNYIFINAVTIHIQYHFCHSSYHIRYFVFDHYNQYNFEKADWKIFAEELILQSNKEEFASNINISQISREMLETEAEKLRDIIIIAVNKAISKKRIHEKSKPW